MKKLTLLLALFCFLKADAQNLSWANTINTTYADYIYDMKVDKEASVIICGAFRLTVDFDPGPGIANMTSAGGTGADIFIAKYDSLGNYLWAHRFGTNFFNDEGDRIATDALGNIFLTGFFNGTVDFDPDSVTVFNIASNFSSRSRFLAKYDKNGNFIAGKNVGNAVGTLPSSQDAQTGLACDLWGNVYMSGFYGTSLTLGPGAGGTLPVSGLSDNYFCKYDTALVLIWAHRIGSNGTEYSQGMHITDSGTVIVLGSFSNTVDFDPDTTDFLLTQSGNTNDGYFAQYDSGGHFVFVKHLAPGGSCTPRAAITDSKGNMLITGSCTAMLDADPDSGVVLIGSGYNDQVFLAAYDTAGKYRWAFAFGDIGTYQSGTSIVLDTADNIYLAGFYTPFVDLDASADTATLGNLYSGFIALYDTGGNFRTAFSGQDATVKLRGNGNAIYMAGNYYGLVDFDPGPAVHTMLSDTLNASWFIVKLDICNSLAAMPGTIQVPAICAGDTITVNVNSGGPQYEWTSTPGFTAIGTSIADSIQFAADTNAVTVTVTCRSIGGCINSAVNYINLTVHHPLTPVITQLIDTLYTTSTALAWQWFLNGLPITGATDSIYVPLANGTYIVSVTDSNGCESASAPFSFVFNGMENSYSSAVTSYPIPFTNILNVECSAPAQNRIITLKDIHGKTVMNQTSTGNKTVLETSQLAPGVYFLEWNDKATVNHLRVIKL